MAKAKKRRAKQKRKSVDRTERVAATPETLAKLEPDQLDMLLRKGPDGGGIDHQHAASLWQIKVASGVVGRGLGYQSVDIQGVGHGQGEMSDGDSRLWDIYCQWSRAFLRATYTSPDVVRDWVHGDRLIKPSDVPLLLHAATSWDSCRDGYDRLARAERDRASGGVQIAA